MRIKQMMSAAVAVSMTATAMLSTVALHAAAADETLTFDFRSNGSNSVTVSAEEIAAGDFTVPFDIFITDNPGVNGISLKLQVNDGEVAEDGSFGNYGLYLTDAAFASPYCFDSANGGNAAKALSSLFTADKMNLNWIYSQDANVNADAAAQPDTTSWDKTADWAETVAFASANLVIPKDTPAGTYTLDVRTDEYVIALSTDTKTQQRSKSACSSAESEDAVKFQTAPLTVTVEEADTPSLDPWVDTYEIEGEDGYYLIIADVSAAPGESVDVPIYVFNDQGTSGMQLFFDYDKALTLDNIATTDENYAYALEPIMNPNATPAVLTFGQAAVETADNGSILAYFTFTVPESATDGTVYEISFTETETHKLKVVGEIQDEAMDVAMYNGSITVVSNGETTLNRKQLNFSKAGETANLTLFNAVGDVTWASSDTAVATVDQNGFVKAVGDGSATITATNNGTDYECAVTVGSYLFGDVNQDGSVSVTDAQAVLISYTEMMVSGKHTLDETQLSIADVDGDGSVGISDARQILIYYTEKMVNPNTTWADIIPENPLAPTTPQ